MRRKLFITLLLIFIVSLAIPVAALAGDVTIDDAYLAANPSPYNLGTHVPNDIITITTSQPVTLYSSVWPLPGIQIVCTGNVDISVDSLFINDLTYNFSPITFTGTGNSITAIGNNTFVADFTQPGIKVEAGAEVTFKGSNSGTSIVGQSGDASDDGTGTAAGIGGSDGNAAGTIIINGSDIQGRATGAGAGVGGGNGAPGGTITVNDGLLEGYSYGGGAGIGGGLGAAGGNITINDGVVIARATGGGAGIGGGYRAEGGNITIAGGSVNSVSNNSGAGIGGGNSSGAAGSGNAGTILITGGNVYGESSSGAGIGSGYLAQNNTGSVTITGGRVEGKAINEGAGIGGGSFSSAGTLTISGGTVTATSVAGRGLGSGDNWGGGSVSISGMVLVYASGDAGLADIGSTFSAFTIEGTAEVFTEHGRIDDSLVTTHIYEPGTKIPAGGDLTGVGNAYKFTSPSGWETASTAGYFALRESVNPQTGDRTSNVYVNVIIAAVMVMVAMAYIIARKKTLIK